MTQRYDGKTAREILQRATAIQDSDDFTRQQLIEMGLEMGLSEAAIVKAEQAYLSGTPQPHKVGYEQPVPDISEEERIFRRERWQDFYGHLRMYLIVIVFLTIMNIFTGLSTPDDIWVVFPALGWGIGLAIHWATVAYTHGETYEQAFDEWYAKREARRLRRQNRPEARSYPPLSDSQD